MAHAANVGNVTFSVQGILNGVSLFDVSLTTWNHTGYPMNDVSGIASLPSVSSVSLPGYFSGNFQLSDCLEPKDTFIDMTGWSKVSRVD